MRELAFDCLGSAHRRVLVELVAQKIVPIHLQDALQVRVSAAQAVTTGIQLIDPGRGRMIDEQGRWFLLRRIMTS